MTFAVVDEPVVSSVGVEFAALADASGVSVAVDPVGDLCTHGFGHVPRKDIAVGFALALVVFLIAAVAFDVELVDDMGVCVGVSLTRTALDRRVDGAPRLGVRCDPRRCGRGVWRGCIGCGCIGCGCIGCGCIGRGCIAVDRGVAIASELVEIHAVGTGSVLCAFVGVSALSVEMVDQILVGTQAVLVRELLERALCGCRLCGGRLCGSGSRLGGRTGECAVAVANEVVHIEAKAACVIGCTFVGVSALLVGVIDHVLVGAKVWILAQNTVERAFGRACGWLGRGGSGLRGSRLCRSRLCRSRLCGCRLCGCRLWKSGVAVANKVVHIEAKAANVVCSTVIATTALSVGVVDHVLVGAKVWMFTEDILEGFLGVGSTGGGCTAGGVGAGAWGEIAGLSERSVGEVGIVEDAVASIGVVSVGIGLFGECGKEFAFGSVGADFLAGALEHTRQAVVSGCAAESILDGGVKEHSASAFGLDAVLISESVGGFKVAFTGEIALNFLEVGVASSFLHAGFDIGVVEVSAAHPVGVAHIVGVGAEDLVEFFGIGLVHPIHQGGEGA